jgi:putative zinc finger/helix-turn-helix YgiT family protein
MNCMMCGEEMESKRANVPYRDLPGIVLAGVEVDECPNCGEREVVIPAIAELNRVLAEGIVRQTERLNAEQVRFLRKHLGLSGVDFAGRMGVAPETVSKWENDKQQIGTTNDRLLRMMVAYEDPIDDYTQQLSEVAKTEPSAPIVKVHQQGRHWLPGEGKRVV